MQAPTLELRNFVRAQGPSEGAWIPLGDAGRVWQVGERIVKQHRSMRAFEQELDALQRWFGERERWRVPELLASDRSLRALVLTRVPGRPVSELGEQVGSPRIHRAAGEFVAALHELAIDDGDPLALPEALALRFRTWRSACADLLEPRWRGWVAELEDRVELFADERRVACHRDYGPSNWLWDGERLAVIDFEHARLDLRWVDLAKLAVGAWQAPGAGSSFTAFMAGAGLTWDEAAVERLRVVVALHGLACLAWGRRHGDSAFVAEGRRALALLGVPGLGL